MIGGLGNDMGLLPRTVHLLFERIRYLEPLGWRTSLKVCFSEIYNEKMVDLLGDSGLEIQEMQLSSLR